MRSASLVALIFALAACADDTTSAPATDGSVGRSDGSASTGDGGAARFDSLVAPRDGGAATTDRGTNRDARGTPTKTAVNLRVTGCGASFAASLFVSQARGTSLTVTALSGSALVGRLRMTLNGKKGAIKISSEERGKTGVIIDLTDRSESFTNVSVDPRVLDGKKTDPVKGTLVAHRFDAAKGIADLEFKNVTLEQTPAGYKWCTIDGTVTAAGVTP